MHKNDDLTGLLRRAAAGDKDAEQRFWTAVYELIRQMAHRQLANDRLRRQVEPTELVNALYVRIATGEPVEWKDRRHFFLVAARVIRNILVDTARYAQRSKRGDGSSVAEFEDWMTFVEGRADEILIIDDALQSLAKEPSHGPRMAEVVNLRYFAGFTEREVGALLGITERTVKRDWFTAKEFFRAYMSG